MSLDIQEQISNTEAKIRILLERYAKCKEELASLQQEIASLRKENEELKKNVNIQAQQFQNQNKMLNIVDYLMADAESPSMLKERINEYIKEIDNCIAYLNGQI
ncbi:MAG: hypothetical protein NZ521_06585 [Flammeovirgaceae bacterium]|nr:hypothetical protein [Flammeovirgaceae bacterium]MDW8287891.1 hypothetical protein [Flammeovirgaceae bacterium]